MKKAKRTIARRFTAVVATSVAAVGLLAAVGLAEELPPPDGVTTETTTVAGRREEDGRLPQGQADDPHLAERRSRARAAR